MSRPAVFHGYVKQGDVVYAEPGRRAAWLLRNEGKRVREELERETNPRSQQQNRYYWRVIVVEYVCQILESLLDQPVSDEDAHAWLKLRFLAQRSVDGVPIPPSTKSLTTEEFSAYCDRIREFFLHKYGITIPAPNEREEAA